MKRGTRVGQAYVSVNVDGDGINEEIVDSVDEAGPGVERAGKEHGQRYGDGFDEGSRGRMRKIFDRIGDRLGKKGFQKLGDEAGDTLGSALVQRLREKLDTQRGFVRDITERYIKAIDDGASDEHLANLTHGLRSATTEASNLERELRKAMEAEGLINKPGFGGGGLGNGKDDRLGDKVGGLLGAGSRNNALNLLGRSMGNIINLTERVGKSAFNMFKIFSAGWSEAGEGASFFQKSLGGIEGLAAAGGEGIMALVASGPAAVAAIAAIVAGMTILASVLGAVAALITAVASGLSGALIGALAVAGPLVASLAVGAGLLTAAFMSMTDAQKTLLKDAFVPLRNEMVGMGQIMLQQMVPAFSTWSFNLQNALMLAMPLVRQLGTTFAEAGNSITASFSGPGFQLFAQSLSTYLPTIITMLASALGEFLNGTLGLFAAIMPYVQRFAAYLDVVALKFQQWATSAEGQNAISMFVARAVADLQALWRMVGAFGGFLAKVLFSPEAMNAGATIFDSIARTFRKMTDGIARAQADGSLKKWFDDAIKFGGQLWGVIEALYGTFSSLYQSGTLNAVGQGMEFFADAVRYLNPLVKILAATLGGPLLVAFASIGAPIVAVGKAIDWIKGKFSDIVGTSQNSLQAILNNVAAMGNAIANAPQAIIPGQHLISKASVQHVQSAGAAAITQTNIPKPKKPKQYKNPYKAWAESLIKDGPSTKAQMKAAMLTLANAALAGVTEAMQAANAKDAGAALEGLVNTMRSSADSIIETARSALNSAAQSLAGASSKKEAKAALKDVKQAQKDWQTAINNQLKIQLAAKMLRTQKIVRGWNVNELLKGNIRANTTLAELAAARGIVAAKLETANAKLADALTLRDDYRKQVADSIKAFGDLTTAQAQTINGVEQALTATDIVGNLQDRLTKIKAFQDNLRLLLAQGLSNDAYKSIVDQGVDAGSKYAEALLGGGVGAIQQTNSLVSQIQSAADALGTETSNRLYQAGVDAAQGLVDGLTSLSKQLDSAAAQLGKSVADAIKKQLGIKSPSTVLRDMMDYVGDGAVLGLDNQHVKVGAAAGRFADQIAVSPEVAAYAAGKGQPPVSGNDGPKLLWTGDINTATEDPHAAAMEMLNEVTGRL